MLTVWRVALEQRLEVARTGLVEVVERSGVLSSADLRDLLSIEDYRGLVLDLGRILDLGPEVLAGCERAAAGIAVFQYALRRWSTRLWRYGGGHLAYVLTPLLGPLILLRRCSVALSCSRISVQFALLLREAWRRAALALSNAAFRVVVNILVAPPVVSILRWIHRRIWPGLSATIRMVGSFISILVLLWQLLASHGRLPAMVRLTLALARRRGNFLPGPDGDVLADPEPVAIMRVADAVLNRQDRTPVRRQGTELWVDTWPDGPLFGATPETGLMALWRRIDAMAAIDHETYQEILGTLQLPTSEVVSAARQILRPPRPLLSAVMVATGLRMGLGLRLAGLRNPHLARESSRWKFFGGLAPRSRPPRRYIVLTPLNNYRHQKPRIAVGKLTARMLEVMVGHSDPASFHFVFALPVCRPGTPEAEERQDLAALVRATLSSAYLPPRASVSILDDLHTDIELPNLKGLPLILALRRLCADHSPSALLALSEMDDSASWLNIPYLADATTPQGPALVTGCRPMLGAGKPVAGHAATRLFNSFFRFAVPNVTAHDSSSVLKVATVASMRTIAEDLTCLDYSIDQDVLAMMAVRGRVIELPIEWYQARGKWGHERTASEQIASILELRRKTPFKRQLAKLRPGEWLPLDAGFDFQVLANDRGRVLKGHAPVRNRLALLLTALRSVMKRNATAENGHREFAHFVPLATRMINIVGQGRLKALLRIAEGRYRDPLPAVREHLKYRVPAIVETTFEWRPAIDTPIGRSRPFLFTLEQPFATFGTLRTAMEWNLRFRHPAGAADTLRVLLHLQKILQSHGVLDPDLKSLLDCGIFVADHGVTVKHLDFAGFLRDPYVIDAVLPHLLSKVESMRDFRQIARCLRATAEGRARVVRFRCELESFIRSFSQRHAGDVASEFAAIAEPEPPALPVLGTRQIREHLLDCVVATAKFATHAPVAPLPMQLLMRAAAVPGITAWHSGRDPLPFRAAKVALSVPEPVFVVGRTETADAIRDAMARFLPGRQYEIVSSNSAAALPLAKLLKDVGGDQHATRVVMNVSGRSSRMQDLLADGRILHKALMPILGRPLFVHALEGLGTLVENYPGRVWLMHPDTLCFWEEGNHWPNATADFVVSLPPEALRLLRAWRGGAAVNGSRAEAVGKLVARCYLAMRTGGYSLPSLMGITKRAIYALEDACQVMALYRHTLAPEGARALGVTPQRAEMEWENCVSIGSKVQVHSTPLQPRFRDCVFNHSEVVFEIDGRLPHVSIEGLVVANSNVRIQIAAPAVRDNLVYRVATPPGKAVLLCLDGQAIAPSADGEACGVPLSLRAFSPDGSSNELLRCPGKSRPHGVEVNLQASSVTRDVLG